MWIFMCIQTLIWLVAVCAPLVIKKNTTFTLLMSVMQLQKNVKQNLSLKTRISMYIINVQEWIGGKNLIGLFLMTIS